MSGTRDGERARMEAVFSKDLCEHVAPGGWPFRALLTLDEHLGLTDALVECRTCGRIYLLEMLDWQNHDRLMRLSMVSRDRAAELIRNLSRGSCDLSRADQEILHLRTATTLGEQLLLIDWNEPAISAIVPTPPDRRVPGASWRDLPCDGSWVRYARSYSDMVKP